MPQSDDPAERPPDRTATLTDALELVQRLQAGDRRALARALSQVENETAIGQQVLQLLYGQAGRAHSIGITGSPGAGKSTLTAAVARAYRSRGLSVGIVAVDPSSTFNHGALLGDRIRMQELTSDPGVFVRSVATRGSVGGLAATAADLVAVLDASGREVIVVETVGAGQDEIEVASLAQTTILVNTPGMGDGIQAIKAGIMEIADIFVVNKADLPGADAAVAQLQALVSLTPTRAWCPPVVRVSARLGEGIEALIGSIQSHWNYRKKLGDRDPSDLERARRQIIAAAQAELARRMRADDDTMGVDALAERVAAHSLDPRSAAGEVLRRLK